MVKESLNTPYNRCVFREPFLDEQSVRNNGGVPTAVTISKGVGSFNGTTSYIKYNNCSNHYPVNTGLSIRIIFELTNLTWVGNNYAVTQYDAGTNNRSWAVSFDDTGFLVFRYSATGVSVTTAQSTVNLKALELNKTYEAMIVTRLGYVDFYLNGILMDSRIFTNNCFITNIPLRIGGTNVPNFSHKLELIEIYQGTLTDSEIKNLYDNKWNKDFISSNLLLDYDSTNGYITDRTGKNTLTATDVSIKKTGSYYSAEFNGVTSKIDTGSDFIGTKAITIAGWVYPKRRGGRIISNNKFELSLSSSQDKFFVWSDASTLKYSDFITYNKLYFLSLIRKSDGKITFYIGDANNAPSLSNTVDQETGTPVAGTINVTIGASPHILANIPMLKVYDGILDLETITQIWSSTRGKIQ